MISQGVLRYNYPLCLSNIDFHKQLGTLQTLNAFNTQSRANTDFTVTCQGTCGEHVAALSPLLWQRRYCCFVAPLHYRLTRIPNKQQHWASSLGIIAPSLCTFSSIFYTCAAPVCINFHIIHLEILLILLHFMIGLFLSLFSSSSFILPLFTLWGKRDLSMCRPATEVTHTHLK